MKVIKNSLLFALILGTTVPYMHAGTEITTPDQSACYLSRGAFRYAYCINQLQYDLLKALTSSNIELLQKTLAHPDFNVNAHIQVGKDLFVTPLMIAVSTIGKGSEQCLQILLKHPNIDINQVDLTGIVTALFFAVEYNYAAVPLLLQHCNLQGKLDLDINYVNKEGETALTWAAFHGCVESVELLLADSRLNLRSNNQGLRAIGNADEYITDEAAYHGKQGCWKGFKIQELIKAKMQEQGIPFETGILAFEKDHPEKSDTAVAAAPVVTPEVAS